MAPNKTRTLRWGTGAKWGIIGALWLSLAACAPDTTQEESEAPEASVSELPAGFAQCSDPRPEMCIQIYQPVCALVDTGVRCVTTPCPSEAWQTRGNGCTACNDERVVGYIDGECSQKD